ncbi:MAG: fibronectin type III domain-containing protein [Bacillota bacterium]|nr:fibronectin type III domain-containing protein [Bacillota bacterium]
MIKKLFLLIIAMLCLTLLIYLNSLTAYCAGFEYIPELAGSKITSCAIDEGTARNCFDGDINTLARSAKVNPAWVQIEFPEKVEIYKAKVSLGQPGYYDTVFNWWLECADSQSDLDNKTNTYKLVVSQKNTTIDSVWDEMKFSSPVTKKIWRFTIKKPVGDEYVQIPELQLLSYYQGIKLDLLSFIKSNSIAVKSNDSVNSDINKCFDENPISYFNSGNTSNILVDTGNFMLTINRIRFFVGRDKKYDEMDRLVLEAADSIADLNSKSNSYKLVYGKGRNIGYENQEDIMLSVPLKKRFWRFYTRRVDSKQPASISEIELWADQRYCDYPPPAPSDVRIIERKDKTAALQWSNIKDETGDVLYCIYRDDKLIGAVSACKYVDNGLIPQKSYTYYVKAYNILRKFSDQSPLVSAMPISGQTAVLDSTAVPTDIISQAATPPLTDSFNSSNNQENQLKSTGNAPVSTALKEDGEDIKTKGSDMENSDSKGLSLKTKIILGVFFVIIAFLAWFISTTLKMKKKMHVTEKKREAELDTIKQLLIEERTEHVIELLDKNKKRK